MNENSFIDDGYIVSERSLEIEKLKYIEDKFDNFEFSKKFVFDPFIAEPNMAEVFFNDGLIKTLRTILGDNFILLADTSLHHGRRNVMHTDNTSLLAEGIDLFDGDGQFRMVTIGTYFQPSNGGDGLRVVPGTHLIDDRFEQYRHASVRNRFLNASRKILPEPIYKYIHPHNFSGQDLENSYGDSVIFDIRIEHRSQYQRFPNDLLPSSKVRKAIFHRACSSDMGRALAYQNYLKNKKDYGYLKSKNRIIPKLVRELAEHYEVTVL